MINCTSVASEHVHRVSDGCVRAPRVSGEHRARESNSRQTRILIRGVIENPLNQTAKSSIAFLMV